MSFYLNPKQKVEKVSLEVKHKNCSGCHDTKVKTGCESCHSSKEMAPFNHLARTGFELKSFHIKLSCTSCHKTKTVFTGLNSSCSELPLRLEFFQFQSSSYWIGSG